MASLEIFTTDDRWSWSFTGPGDIWKKRREFAGVVGKGTTWRQKDLKLFGKCLSNKFNPWLGIFFVENVRELYRIFSGTGWLKCGSVCKGMNGETKNVCSKDHVNLKDVLWCLRCGWCIHLLLSIASNHSGLTVREWVFFLHRQPVDLPTKISKEWQIHQQTSWRVCHFIWYIFHAGVLRFREFSIQP